MLIRGLFLFAYNADIRYNYIMLTDEEEKSVLKYEIEEIEKMILAVLEKHARGVLEDDIIAQMPKDLHEKVTGSVLVLLVNNGSIVPVLQKDSIVPTYKYRINKRKYKESPFAGFLDDELNDMIDERIANGEPYD